jgi:hypothetical protein
MNYPRPNKLNTLAPEPVPVYNFVPGYTINVKAIDYNRYSNRNIQSQTKLLSPFFNAAPDALVDSKPKRLLYLVAQFIFCIAAVILIMGLINKNWLKKVR